jgi:nucleoside phosphorylase
MLKPTGCNPWVFSLGVNLSTIAFDDPCLLFAMRRESAAFCREFRPQQRFPGAPCRARFCGPAWLSVLVVETGVGREATQKALDWLLSRPTLENVTYRPKVVLSAGFGGALDPQLAIGDIVLATEIVDAEGTCVPAPWPPKLPDGDWLPPLNRGRVLTIPDVASTPERKAELAQKHQAIVVDMEAAIVARACARNEIPFGCVRAVSDCAQTSLSPRLARLLQGGRVSLPRVLVECIRSLPLMGELWRLAGNTRRASHQLGMALGELLTLTLPWNAAVEVSE